MTGEDWLSACPADCCDSAYGKHVLDGVRSGVIACEWPAIQTQSRGHRLECFVSDDALRLTLADGSRFRPQMSASLLQLVADELDAVMLTSFLCDVAFEQSGRPPLNAQPLDVTNRQAEMATMAMSHEYNAKVEKARAGRTGLIRDCGKTWIVSNLLKMRHGSAVNYGFFVTGNAGGYESHSGLRLWQTRGTRHDEKHLDYSQVGLLVLRQCLLDGETVNIDDLYKSNEYSGLVSDEGPLAFTRQP